MTLNELKIRVDFYCAQEGLGDRLKVCVPNGNPGFGPTQATAVKGAGRGIDWNADKFLIHPEVDMVEKPVKQD